MAGAATTVGRKKKILAPGVEPAAVKRIAVQASLDWVEWVERRGETLSHRCIQTYRCGVG